MRLLIILTLCAYSFLATANEHQGVWVSGFGSAEVKPDMVSVNLVVSTLDKSASKAQGLNAKIASTLLDKIKNHGVAGKDIQTSSFNVSPEYDYQNGKRLLRGHRVQHAMSVTLRKVNVLGEFLDDLTAVGDSISINGISFGISAKEKLKIQALESAIANAREKAQAMASAAKKKLGQVVAVEEVSSNTPDFPRPMFEMQRMKMAEASTPIESGEVAITANVRVHFEFN